MKHLTKPIRAIHFLVLAFLMTLSSPVAAQDFQKGEAAYKAGDYATAFQEWTPLAEGGNSVAQFALGLMLERGTGVLQNVAEAARWYQLAADQGHDNAQYFLGNLYDKGKGVPQDFAVAVKWYTLAAQQGNLIAQVRLSAMYTLADGVPEDFTKALKWSLLAAKEGSLGAQVNLGLIHEYSNHETFKDNLKAHMWYNIASANGDENADEWRDELEGLMTKADISKAQAMARECMNSGYTKCGY
ncbi:sel1 repeat family protein [Planktomarina temperata]|nr:sel1 repeat family protein [Planktomarina temperata]